MKKISLFLALLTGSLLTAAQETSVLFIGNSFTFMNNMPYMFRDIAVANGREVHVDTLIHGGKDLNFHANRAATYEKIKSRKWDYIIIQASSNELAQPDSKVAQLSLPFARRIVDSIRAENRCTQVMLYMTWAYKYGNPNWAPIASYDSMQYRVKRQYLRLASTLDAKVAPVGAVWSSVRANHSDINLYDPDNHHPTAAGSYISACTFYASIFSETPVGNKAVIEGVDEKTRTVIEKLAFKDVFGNLKEWRLLPDADAMKTGFEYTVKNDVLKINNTSANASAVEWDFGDGHTSSEKEPEYCYSSKGTYKVTQKVKNSCKTSYLVKQVEIK